MSDEKARFHDIRLIVFDLDGTLVDTFQDIAAAANHALAELGRPPMPLETIISYVGHGGRNLMERCLDDGASEEDTDRAFAAWRAYYSEHPADLARPYPGVVDTLAELKRRGIRMAVLSNKVHDLTVAIIEHLDMAHFFDAVQGQTDSFPLKPAPGSVEALMHELDASPSQTLMVGDGDADIKVAHAAHLAGAIGVSYGVNSAEDLRTLGAATVVDSFDALPELLA